MGLCMMLVLLFGLIATGGTLSIDMCKNSKTPNRPNDDELNLIAIGPTIESLSKSCSCLINATSEWNTTTITISRTNELNSCVANFYDNAALEIINSRGKHQVNLQRDELADYSSNFDSVSAIRVNITLHSFCSSNYTMQLKESTYYMPEFSQVTCTYTQVITTPPFAEASTISTTSRGDFQTKRQSTYSPMETYSHINEQTPAPSAKTGLIVGIVVGVGVGLILISILVFCGYRAKHQRKTNPKTNSSSGKSNHQTPGASETLEGQTDDNLYATCVTDDEFCRYNVLVNRQQPTSDGGYEKITPRPSSSSPIDNYTTLVENDLYT